MGVNPKFGPIDDWTAVPEDKVVASCGGSWAFSEDGSSERLPRIPKIRYSVSSGFSLVNLFDIFGVKIVLTRDLNLPMVNVGWVRNMQDRSTEFIVIVRKKKQYLL